MVRFILLALLCTLSLRASQQTNDNHSSTSVYVLYELYSWQDAKKGEWNFSVLYNTSREKSVNEVFNKKTLLRGVDQLKVKISSMPRGSKIIWNDELLANGSKQKGSERLKYPPEEIVQEVKQCAQARNVEVLGPFRPDAP
jgi:hypothetical protein